MFLSPLDTRYKKSTEVLTLYLSDKAVTYYRHHIEINYLKSLVKTLHNEDINFSYNCDYDKIKEIEKTTNHDIKAIEYYIKDNLDKYKNLVHFGLTSQDINSLTNSLILRETVKNIFVPNIENIVDDLKIKIEEWHNIPMLARTHGQPATPTTISKELKVFKTRLENQIIKLKEYKWTTKFGGATGNLNAHKLCYPEINWYEWMDNFIFTNYKIKRNQYTTQVDHYDNITELFDIIKRINLILLDLNTDVWLYISIDYFKLNINKDEVGSSTMPHKVNPINFENSEGNIHMANGILNTFISKLPVSRYQRDLSDSTICRNFGVAFGHCLLAYKNTLKGLRKITINSSRIAYDLNKNWAILTEAVQYMMKKEGIDDAYEQMKEIVRTDKKFKKEDYINLIENLEGISDDSREILLNLTPFNYL